MRSSGGCRDALLQLLQDTEGLHVKVADLNVKVANLEGQVSTLENQQRLGSDWPRFGHVLEQQNKCASELAVFMEFLNQRHV